ncbi:MAG: glycerol acyltransferase [Calditrichaeota bacterium]|nr:MAG: glycerol acyltransferase [Calditrichota bacterium]
MAMKKGNSFRSRYNIPGILCRIILAAIGWKTSSISQLRPKFVLIGAPHTSNWDFVLGYLAMTAIGLRLHWVGKHTLFRPPIGWFLKWMGGIPVNRGIRRNFVDQVIRSFRDCDQLIVAIAPEGTRKKTDRWKSGFYYIARGAQVPLVLGFVDYAQKSAGIGKIVEVTGDMEKDLEEMREFYIKVVPRHPEKFGEIRIINGK